MNFWSQLPKNFFALAPMADVTDAAYREVIAECGKPDVMWTEFVSSDGLFLAPEQGRKFWLPDELRQIAVEHGVASDNPLLKDLIFNSEKERPIVAQFFSRDPDRMRRSARLAADLGYDGVDINMGCPAKVIVRQGAGCAMIKEPQTAVAVISAAIEGAAGRIPVSVKTRTGFTSDTEREEWLTELLQTDIAALSLHARTRKDMSKVPARWENVSYLVELRDKINPEIVVLGNGDIDTLSEGHGRIAETGVDGIMIGRGIFGNPWRFNKDLDKADLSDKTIFTTLLRHSDLYDKYLGDTKNYALMRKHFKSYLKTTTVPHEVRKAILELDSHAGLQDFYDQMTFDARGAFVTI